MKIARLVLGVICLALLTGTVAAGADGADQLYEFKMKGQDWTDIVGEKYVWFSKKKGRELYDARTGEQIWKHKELPGYDGNFALNWEDRFLLYSTKKGVARLDIPTGEVAWSKELSNLKFKDVDRYWETDYGAVFQIKNNFMLLDPETGEEKWSLPVEPSSKLAKEGIPWFHDLGDRLLIMAKDGPTLIDPSSGTVLYTVKDKYNKKIDEPVISLGDKALFFFDKGLRVVDLNSGEETFAIEGKVEETTSLKAIEVGGKTYIFFGFNKQLIAFDGETGQKVWQTAEGSVEGSVRWVGSAPGSDNVLIITLRADKFGGDAGT